MIILKYWRGALIGLLALTIWGAYLKGAHDANEKGKIAHQIELAKVQMKYALEAERQKRVNKDAVQYYQAELNGLRNKPARVVRLCTDSPSVPAAGRTGRPDGAASRAGSIPQMAGRDIGRELFELADEADKCSARLRHLQGWASETVLTGDNP